METNGMEQTKIPLRASKWKTRRRRKEYIQESKTSEIGNDNKNLNKGEIFDKKTVGNRVKIEIYLLFRVVTKF